MLAVIDQDFAGITDVNGAFTLPATAPSPTMWAALKATVETVGQARWRVFVGGAPQALPIGDRIDVPLLVMPAQKVSIQVQNALAGQPVTGKLHGMAGSTLEEVAPFISLAPTPLTVDLASTPVFQGNLQGSPGGTNLSLTLPATCYAIEVVAAAIDANSHVKVTGVQSGNTYLDVNLVTVGQQVFAPSAGPFDPRDFAQDSITVTVSNAVTTNTTLYFLCKGAVIPANTKSLPLWVVTAGFNVGITGQPISVQASPTGLAIPQAYASAELSAVGVTVMVTGSGLQKVRLFGWTIEIDQATGTTIGWLEDTVSAAGTVSARLAANASASNATATGNEGGKPLSVGQGIRLNVPALAAGGVVRAMVGYSQG